MAQVVYIDSRTACNGSCETAHGCDCCKQFMPAECSTEIGADQDEPAREPMTAADAVFCVLVGLCSVLLVISAGHAIATLWTSYQ
jgi:hypothetical protein